MTTHPHGSVIRTPDNIRKGRGILRQSEDIKVVFANNRWMKEVEDESIPCGVTSPPYPLGIVYQDAKNWAARRESGKLGWFERPVFSRTDYQRFLSGLWPSFREVDRKVMPGGYFFVNACNIHTDSDKWGRNCSVPYAWDIARFFTDKLGWDLKTEFVWECVRLIKTDSGQKCSVMGSYPQPLEGVVRRTIEYVLQFRKPGVNKQWRRVGFDPEKRRASSLTLERWKSVHDQLWQFAPARKMDYGGVIHPAPFPVELPLRCIDGWSILGDTILDPFLGTGPTLLAAKMRGRKGIGYEVDPAFEPLIEKTLDSRSEELDFLEPDDPPVVEPILEGFEAD